MQRYYQNVAKRLRFRNFFVPRRSAQCGNPIILDFASIGAGSRGSWIFAGRLAAAVGKCLLKISRRMLNGITLHLVVLRPIEFFNGDVQTARAYEINRRGKAKCIDECYLASIPACHLTTGTTETDVCDVVNRSKARICATSAETGTFTREASFPERQTTETD